MAPHLAQIGDGFLQTSGKEGQSGDRKEETAVRVRMVVTVDVDVASFREMVDETASLAEIRRHVRNRVAADLEYTLHTDGIDATVRIA